MTKRCVLRSSAQVAGRWLISTTVILFRTGPLPVLPPMQALIRIRHRKALCLTQSTVLGCSTPGFSCTANCADRRSASALVRIPLRRNIPASQRRTQMRDKIDRSPNITARKRMQINAIQRIMPAPVQPAAACLRSLPSGRSIVPRNAYRAVPCYSPLCSPSSPSSCPRRGPQSDSRCRCSSTSQALVLINDKQRRSTVLPTVPVMATPECLPFNLNLALPRQSVGKAISGSSGSSAAMRRQ